MRIKPEEVSKIIREEIESYKILLNKRKINRPGSIRLIGKKTESVSCLFGGNGAKAIELVFKPYSFFILFYELFD